MKKYLLNIICFTLLLVLLNIPLTILSNRLLKYNDYKKVSLNFNSYLFADSHGVPLKNNTEKFGVFNFSAGSESYYDMKRKLGYLLKHTKIDTVYISVDDHTLSPYRENTNNLDLSHYFTAKADYNNFYDFFRDNMKYHICFFQPRRGIVVRGWLYRKVTKLISDNKNQSQIVPWHKMKREQRVKLMENRITYQFPSNLRSLKLQKALQEIIEMCNINNVTLIGVKFPLCKDYSKMTNDRTYGASEIFRENNLRVLDYTNVITEEDEYFSNQDHLNDTGGMAFVNLWLGNKTYK